MKEFYKPKVVMSIHGILSTGKWQDSLNECIKDAGLISLPYKYGVKVLRVLPHHIQNDVKRFRDWYFSNVNDSNLGLKISEPFHRPSIIAHSLGTWIIAQALMTYPEIKFDKMFLFGSIIPQDFDWFKLILGDQVNSVIYEKASKDWVVKWGVIFTGSLRPCGRRGFNQKSSFLRDEEFSNFGHSTFNYTAHFREKVINRLDDAPHQLSAIAGRSLSVEQVKRIFKNTNKIDKVVYPANYNSDPIPIGTVIEWFSIEKDIWSFVINSYTQNTLGYVNAVPVKDDVYNEFCQGNLSEKDIKASQIVDYDTDADYNLIVLSIAIKKGIEGEETMINKGRISEMLIMSFIYKVNQHNRKKNRLKKMAAFAWTQSGEKLCQGFCMKKVANSTTEFPLYEVDFTKIHTSQLKDGNFMAKWWYEELINV